MFYLACKKTRIEFDGSWKKLKKHEFAFRKQTCSNSWMPGFRSKNCWKNMHSFFVGPKTLRYTKSKFLRVFFFAYPSKNILKNLSFACLSVLGPTRNECMFFQQFLFLKPGIHEFWTCLFSKSEFVLFELFSAAIKFNSRFLQATVSSKKPRE